MSNIPVLIDYIEANGRFTVKAPPWLVDQCRSIPSRRFVKTTRIWVAPGTRINAAYLLRVFSAAEWTRGAQAAATTLTTRETEEDLPPFPAWYQFKTKPFQHQLTALNKAWPRSKFALFMEMGTGKTKTAIDLASCRAMDNQIGAALIVCPLVVVRNWQREIEMHSSIHADVYTVSGKDVTKESEIHKGGIELADRMRWIIVNIEALSQGNTYKTLIDYIADQRIMSIVDESSRIKNHKAMRTKRCIRIGEHSKSALVLSGTPVLQGPIDLYSQFEFLDTNIIGIGDYYCFRNRYAVMGGFNGKQIIGYQNTEELMALLKPYVYQILKRDALDLPDKVYTRLPVKLTAAQHAVLKTLKGGIKLDGKDISNVLERVLRMQQAVAGFNPVSDDEPNKRIIPLEEDPKLLALLEITEEAQGSVVIWTQFVQQAKDAAMALELQAPGQVELHIGEMKPKERDAAIQRFERGERRFFISTLAAGGIGINLVRASTVVYLGNSWSLEHRLQSEDRSHRIGQTRSVQYIDILAEGSVDKLVEMALLEKKGLAQYVQEALRENADQLRGLI